MEVKTPEQSKQLETVDIPAIEVFSEGTWNGDKYDHGDLQAMVDAFNQVGFEPTVKAGHADGQEDEKKARMVFGAPALGYAKRIWIDGKKLFAELKQVPRRFADLIKAGAFKRVSSEIYWNYKRESGDNSKTYPRVLKSIAFLGTEIPALTDLSAIESLYEKNIAGGMFAYDEKKNEFRLYHMDMLSSGSVTSSFDAARFLIGLRRKAKVDVNFVDLAATDAQCGDCRYYLEDVDACTLVEGYIEDDDGCDLFEADTENYASKQKIKEYTVEKRGSQWCLIAKSTGKTLGCHDTEEGAMAQERAVQANKHSDGGTWITVKEMEDICPSCADSMRAKNFSRVKIADESGRFLKEFLVGPGTNINPGAVAALCDKFGDKEGFRTRCMAWADNKNVNDPGGFCNDVKAECFEEGNMFKTHMTREEISSICVPCGESMREKGISALTFSDEQVAKFAGMDMKACMEDATKVKEYPDEGKRKVACQAEMDKAVMQAIQETKGGPNMDEKKFEQEKTRLEAEKVKAENQAREYKDKLSALEASNEEAKQKESEALAKVKKLERKSYDTEIDTWLASEKRAGKIAPVEEPRLRAIFSALYEDQRIVAFSQPDGSGTKEVKESLADAVKSFISKRPSIFREMSQQTDEAIELDDVGDEVDRKTKEHMAKSGIKNYGAAMKAVLALKENEMLATKWVKLQQ